MEQESLTRNHLREASGKHLGGIWEASGRHLGGIREASGRHLGLQPAVGLQEAPNHKNRCLSQQKSNISIKMLILHRVFTGQITK